MKLIRSILFLLAIFFSGCSDKIIRIVRTKPFTPEWQFTESKKSDWQPAVVPGLVQTDLLRLGKIEPPLFDSNEKKLQWISETDWTYKAVFNADDSLMQFHAVDFIFKGIDTYATIFLNDSILLKTNNMFREWRADGRKFLKSGSNTLVVQLHSPSAKGALEKQKLPYQLPMGSDAGTEKISSFVRKAPYHFGWDWSPRFLTMGIWQPVQISAHDKVYISSIQIKTIEIADTCAWLSAFVTIHTHADLPNAVITIKDGFKQFKLEKGTTTTMVKFKIDNPELWWPNGFGKQPLYDITAKLYINGYLVDTIATRTGIRTVELFQDEDEYGNNFYFRVNGLPVFMKGANYIPQSNFLTEITDSGYVKIIGDVKSTGMNMLRVWGGGAYEKDIFYNLCDENGIMVWQDFMFAGSMYPGDSSFVENVSEEITYQVQRLCNHPSIALWCGNNEIDVAWKNWGWQKEMAYTPEDSAMIRNDYDGLFEKQIPALLARYDDTRPYIPSSPSSNWGKHENFTHGNMHYWGVWHGDDPIDSFSVFVPRFMTEYGMQSYPSYKTLLKNTDDDRITLGSEFLKNRQRSYKGNSTLIKYVEQKFGAFGNVEDLCYLSQLNQAEALRIAIESHRREARYCMGSLYWQLNDVWDGASWSTIQHDGTWKAAHYALKRLYAEHILITETKNDTVNLFLQSDNMNGVHGKLVIEVMDFKGRSIGNYRTDAGVGYLVAEKYFAMPLRQLLRNQNPASFFMHVKLLEGDSILAETNYFFADPKDRKIAEPKIIMELQNSDAATIIHLKSETLASGVMLETDAAGKFSDNYFDLLPGQEKTIQFSGVLNRDQLSIQSYFMKK